MARRRWPGWVYDHGDEPDYRFSFANERTFLAWVRTALALVAAGVALDAVSLDFPDVLQRTLSAVLVVLGMGCALAAWARWASAERAMRRGSPFGGLRIGAALAVVLVLTCVALLVAIIVT